MGADCSRQCRCHCNERECVRPMAIVGGLGMTAVTTLFILPYLWANPFDGSGDGDCENDATTPLAAAIPFPLLFGAAVFFVVASCETATNCGALLIASFVSFFGLVCAAAIGIASIALSDECSEDSHGFSLSVGLLTLPIPIVVLVCLNHCLWERRPTIRWNVANVIVGARNAAKTRTPTAQRVLRDALVLGDSHLVDLLLDLKGQAHNPCWRSFRCVFLAMVHCQLRCTCFVRGGKKPQPQQQESSPTSEDISPAKSTSSLRLAGRADLDYCYKDLTGAEYAVHYLARGLLLPSSQEMPERGFNCCRRRLRMHVPRMTDPRRARLLCELLSSGRLTVEDLRKQTATGETSMHAAASTGSIEVIKELVSWLGTDLVDFSTEDCLGNSACMSALRTGHVECARLCAGLPGVWPGLPKLEEQRALMQSSLEDALRRLKPVRYQLPTREVSCAVHTDDSEVLTHLERQVAELSENIGYTLPRPALEALLHHHGFSAEAAARAFGANPRECLDAAGLADVVLRVAGDVVPAPDEGSHKCMVCFDDIAPTGVCWQLPCQHPTCDDCLCRCIDVKIEEGDIAGIICPQPACKLAISDAIVGSLFGEGSPQREKLQKLKAQKFVDLHPETAWCPKPGCGRSISMLVKSQVPGYPSVVACSCGTRFCFNCKELGGHEPVSCEAWHKWREEVEKVEKCATRRWLLDNSKECSCGAMIQRTGGCNHMICRNCGRHFCYVCGADWNLHLRQEGGLDYFTCRLGKEGRVDSGQSQSSSSFEACLRGFRANEREASHQEALVAALVRLATMFELRNYLAVIHEGSAASLSARALLRNLYVLKHSWTQAEWMAKLDIWVGDLERTVGALEFAMCLELLQNVIQEASIDGHHYKPHVAETDRLLSKLDLRSLVTRLVAVDEVASALDQLTTAVVLQHDRIIDAARSGFKLLDRPKGIVEEALQTATQTVAAAVNHTPLRSMCPTM